LPDSSHDPLLLLPQGSEAVPSWGGSLGGRDARPHRGHTSRRSWSAITFWASAVAPKRCPRPRAVLRRICHVMRS